MYDIHHTWSVLLEQWGESGFFECALSTLPTRGLVDLACLTVGGVECGFDDLGGCVVHVYEYIRMGTTGARWKTPRHRGLGETH